MQKDHEGRHRLRGGTFCRGEGAPQCSQGPSLCLSASSHFLPPHLLLIDFLNLQWAAVFYLITTDILGREYDCIIFPSSEAE